MRPLPRPYPQIIDADLVPHQTTCTRLSRAHDFTVLSSLACRQWISFSYAMGNLSGLSMVSPSQTLVSLIEGNSKPCSPRIDLDPTGCRQQN
jgi:hypothetical protein